MSSIDSLKSLSTHSRTYWVIPIVKKLIQNSSCCFIADCSFSCTKDPQDILLAIRGYSSIHSVRGIVRPAFQMAVEDDLLRKNPFEFQLCTVVVNDSVTRQAITKEQEELFLEFIRNDAHYSKYYNGMFILFKTGLRISEFCGLTVKDIDLQERKINVNHQLQRTRGMQYVIEDTKTSSGTRMLPMTDEVYECFEQIVKNRKKVRVEPIIDGYSRFLFLDKKDMPEVALHWEKHFQWALGKYNRTHEKQMPKITPHGRVIIGTS